MDATVDSKMISAIKGAKKIDLYTNNGKNYTLDAPFEEMIDICAFIVARTSPSLVLITAYNDNNKRRVIDYRPSTGNYDVDVNEWTDDRMCEISLDIVEPSDEDLWDAIAVNHLQFRKENSDLCVWVFSGKHCDVANFIRTYYARNMDEGDIDAIIGEAVIL